MARWILVAGILGTILYLWQADGVTDLVQLAISTIGFVIWVCALGVVHGCVPALLQCSRCGGVPDCVGVRGTVYRGYAGKVVSREPRWYEKQMTLILKKELFHFPESLPVLGLLATVRPEILVERNEALEIFLALIVVLLLRRGPSTFS